MSVPRFTLLALATCALALAAAAPAAAAPQAPWHLPAVDLSSPDNLSYRPRLGVGPDGSVTVVWGHGNERPEVIQATTIRPDGTFEAPVNLSASEPYSNIPEIAVAPDGTTTVVWERNVDNSPMPDRVVQAATRPPGGSFGSPVTLSDPSHDTPAPQVAVGPDGTTVVVWQLKRDSDRIVQAATRPPGANSFGTPETLSPPGENAQFPQVAIAPDKTTTVVWHRFQDFSNVAVQAVTRPPGGSFGSVEDLSGAGVSEGPQIATGPDGQATVAWQHGAGSQIAEVTTRPPSGSFGVPVPLSGPDVYANTPVSRPIRIVIAPDGTTTIVWQRRSGPNQQVIEAATRPPDGDFSAPEVLSDSDRFSQAPSATVAPDGTVTVAWASFKTGDPNRTQAVVRPSGGSFGAPEYLSAPGGDVQFPEVIAAPDGTVTAAWMRHNGSGFIVQAVATKELGKPDVPANPPNNSTAIYDSATGKLKIRLKCGPQYKPKCLTMLARAVTNTGKKAKVMSSQVKVKNRKAGRWGYATLKVKPKFRNQVKNMGNKTTKTLWTRITVTWKKKGKKRSKTIHHRYRVMVR